jgi:hypothetical protein
MGYQPIKIRGVPKSKVVATTMAPKGVDLRDLPQLLDPNYAQKNVNYLVTANGRLKKRKGATKNMDAGTDIPVTLWKKFDDDTFIAGYGTTIARYTISTDTLTTIKANFSANNGFDGTRYGANNFFVCNGVDKIWRINAAYAISEIAASPICNVLTAIGNRLYCGNLSTDSTAVRYSMVDDGTATPFNTWTDGALATQAGTVYYRNGGTVRSIIPFGQLVVVLQDEGKNAFYLNTIDVAGLATKVEVIQDAKEDFGGQRGAISTEDGIFFMNKAGLCQLLNVGQTNLPANEQEAVASVLVGPNYFDNADFSQMDMTYDARERNILVTYANNSSVNNAVLVYNLDRKSISTIQGWTINRFYNDDQTIYGASSIATKAYELFSGSSDDGLNIGTEYKQELTMGALYTKKFLKGLYVQGFLSSSSDITVKFDVYSIEGRVENNKLQFSWTAQYSNSGFTAYNSAAYNSAAWNGASLTPGLVESFDGCRPFIRNCQRIILHIVSGDKLAHEINWISIEAQEKTQIRRRHLTLLT